MPFQYRTCAICGHRRICRLIEDEAEGIFEKPPTRSRNLPERPSIGPFWVCECCDDAPPDDWPTLPSTAKEEP